MPTFDAQKEILCALMDLNKYDFIKFIFELNNEEENPRIRKSEVEGKSRVEVTELLMSRHNNKSEAVDRTIRTLRAIGCNNGATELESRKEAHSSNLPSLNKPGPAAKPPHHVTNNVPKTLQKVKIAAPKAEKLPDSGDVKLLFGQHKGRSFEWLRINKVEYVAYVVGSHQMERENGSTTLSLNMKHKDDLAEYVSHFPDVVEKVRLYKEGQALVGFGKYKKSTRKELYESTDAKKNEYIQWLKSMKTHVSPVMAATIKYIHDRSPTQSDQSETRSAMSSKDIIRRNKTSLVEILSGDHMLILNKVQKHSLISNRAITNLKGNNENAKGHLRELLDKLMKKGEKTCQIFIKLLNTDDAIQKTFPDLKSIQWTVDNREKQGAKLQESEESCAQSQIEQEEQDKPSSE